MHLSSLKTRELFRHSESSSISWCLQPLFWSSHKTKCAHVLYSWVMLNQTWKITDLRTYHNMGCKHKKKMSAPVHGAMHIGCVVDKVACISLSPLVFPFQLPFHQCSIHIYDKGPIWRPLYQEPVSSHSYNRPIWGHSTKLQSHWTPINSLIGADSLKKISLYT